MKEADITKLIRLHLSDTGLPDGIIIPCLFFKPNGKYYMEEDILIPLDTKDFNIVEEIKKNSRMDYFIITGLNLRGVPFLIPNWNI